MAPRQAQPDPVRRDGGLGDAFFVGHPLNVGAVNDDSEDFNVGAGNDGG